MSCGTPVICSNTSCFPEIVEDLDVMVEPNDVKATEEKILAILRDRESYNTMSNKCYEKSQKYSWAESATQYHKAFVEILNKQ